MSTNLNSFLKKNLNTYYENEENINTLFLNSLHYKIFP